MPSTVIATDFTDQDEELGRELSRFFDDPLGFVMFAFPWGEPGILEKETGPDADQTAFLNDIGRAVRERAFNGTDPVDVLKSATSSGRGTGKTVRAAWLHWWIMSTRPQCRGTVTANTNTQLQATTWAGIRYWHSLLINKHWFEVTSERAWHKLYPHSWFTTPQTCKEENSQAFAGQHAKNSTSFYIFDEDSNVPDKIHEVAISGMVSGEPMIYLFGNCTRRQGQFYRAVFGEDRNKWITRIIDSRNSAFSNKKQIEEWKQQYGEDSDYFRVWVRGLPPSAGDFQFIDSERIYQAQGREVYSLADEPLLCGVDVARGGGDQNVIRFRRGLDARKIPPKRIPGEETRDSTLMVGVLAEILSDKRTDRRVSMMFVDSGFGGPIVNRLHQLGFKNVVEVNFGSASPDPHQANMRAHMWQKMKDWLLTGAIDSDARLELDLGGPGYHHDKRDRLVLESKDDMRKRGLDSPDDGDALALTFAQQVAPNHTKRKRTRYIPSAWS